MFLYILYLLCYYVVLPFVIFHHICYARPVLICSLLAFCSQYIRAVAVDALCVGIHLLIYLLTYFLNFLA